MQLYLEKDNLIDKYLSQEEGNIIRNRVVKIYEISDENSVD